MNGNAELETWRSAWHGSSDVTSEGSSDLLREMLSQERRLRRRYVAELGVAAALIAAPVFVLWYLPSLRNLAWAIVVWGTTLVATVFSVWNWRGLWRATSFSTQDYVMAYEKRCLASLRAVRFGYGLLAGQLAITVPWLTVEFLHGPSPRTDAVTYALSMSFLAALTATFVWWFARTRRRTLVELQRIHEFRSSASEPE